MRIISGKYKGRVLQTVKDNSVRPTADRVKEAIFNLIQDRVGESQFLDLFAGSGAIGIEALSRGAGSVTFIENSRASISVMQQNLDKVGGEYQILPKDYRIALRELSMSGKSFDIIFIDPPYGKKLEDSVIALIDEYGLLSEHGIIVLERKKGDAPYIIPESMGEIDARNYGMTTISIIKKASKVAITGTFDPFTVGHLHLVEQACEKFDLVHIVILINPDKEAVFSMDKRIKFIEKSTAMYKKQIKVAHYSGMAIDYCRINGIKYIIRGVRNPDDYEYECQMAEYNKEHGDITTIMIDAKDTHISSTYVKQQAEQGGELEQLVDKSIIKDIIAEGKKWRT